jgi:hypothetical protein
MSKQVQVTLLRDHTHAGKKRRAGEKITVSEATRNWLLAQRVIAAEPAPVAADKSKTGGDK